MLNFRRTYKVLYSIHHLVSCIPVIVVSNIVHLYDYNIIIHNYQKKLIVLYFGQSIHYYVYLRWPSITYYIIMFSFGLFDFFFFLLIFLNNNVNTCNECQQKLINFPYSLHPPNWFIFCMRYCIYLRILDIPIIRWPWKLMA